MDPVPLDYFLYVSRALHPFNEEELATLLVRSRGFNAEHDVTGLLLYDFTPALDAGQFCQYVEGPAAAIVEVRARIEADDRHTAIHYIDKGHTVERLFTSWAMGYQSASDLPDVEGFRHLTAVTIPRDGLQKRPATLMRVFLEIANRPHNAWAASTSPPAR